MHGKVSQCEQRASIRFCIKLGKTGGETGWMIQDVYQVECLSQPHIYKWYKRFKAGQEEDDGEGSPVTVQSDNAVVHARKSFAQTRLTVYSVAVKVVVSYGT